MAEWDPLQYSLSGSGVASEAGNTYNLGGLDHYELLQQLPLDNRIPLAIPSSAQPKALLPDLPPELWNIILLHLDIQTLTICRRVSHLLRETISALPEYGLIYKHAPVCLRALLALDAARWTTIHDLYLVLTTAMCEYCPEDGSGRIGEMLYLFPPVRRVCNDHVLNAEELRPFAYRHAKEMFKLPDHFEDGLPILKSIYRYPTYGNPIPSQRLVEITDIERVLSQASARNPKMRRLKDEMTKKLTDFHIREVVNLEGRRGSTKKFIVNTKNKYGVLLFNDRSNVNPLRNMAVVRAPYLRINTKKRFAKGVMIEWGVKCPWCFRGSFPVFPVERFLEHHRTEHVLKKPVTPEPVELPTGPMYELA